jgi:hypothetical protein
MSIEIDVTECPDCSQKGQYEGRVLYYGRGVYTCPDGHKWQDAHERPSSKGAGILGVPAGPGEAAK